jgi:hypothetical protein
MILKRQLFDYTFLMVEEDEICFCEWSIHPPSMCRDNSKRRITKIAKNPEFSVALSSFCSHDVLEIGAYYDGNCKYAAIGIAVTQRLLLHCFEFLLDIG